MIFERPPIWGDAFDLFTNDASLDDEKRVCQDLRSFLGSMLLPYGFI